MQRNGSKCYGCAYFASPSADTQTVRHTLEYEFRIQVLMKSLKDFKYDGKAVLRKVIEASEYKSLPQAVAALTMFSHPETVRQTVRQTAKESISHNLFQVVRCKSNADRGVYKELDGKNVMLDDNSAPTEAFVWANRIPRNSCKDVQFNHIWPDSKSVLLYTNLTNICLTPAFIAKLTDTDTDISSLLKYRAYELYKEFLPHVDIPSKPSEYSNLSWAKPLPVINDLEKILRSAMENKPKNRTVCSARSLGWFFSDFLSDKRINCNA
jgi:hypothetical protein